MLEMKGFNQSFTETYWKGRINKRNIDTTSDLFLFTYDVMRLHFPSVIADGRIRQVLELGSNADLVLGYEDSQRSDIDVISITAHRGMLSEHLRLPRTKVSSTMEEPLLYIQDYRSLLMQRQLREDEEPEACPELGTADIQNTAITIWRARSFK